MVWLKSLGLVPAKAIPLIVSDAPPVFDMVTGRVEVPPAGVVEKASEVGDSDTVGTGTAVPVPVRVRVWGEFEALSAMLSVAL